MRLLSQRRSDADKGWAAVPIGAQPSTVLRLKPMRDCNETA